MQAQNGTTQDVSFNFLGDMLAYKIKTKINKKFTDKDPEFPTTSPSEIAFSTFFFREKMQSIQRRPAQL